MSKTENSPAAWVVRASNVRIPEGERRNPIVFLDLQIGPDWGCTVALQRLKKAGFIMRMPTSFDGGDGIRPSPSLLTAMERAAVEALKAAPEAFEHLARKTPARKRKVDAPKPEAVAA